jgi:hypothetical protein
MIKIETIANGEPAQSHVDMNIDIRHSPIRAITSQFQ